MDFNKFKEARLTAKQRKALPKSSFGVASKAKTSSGRAKSGSYPINDKAHARAALRLIGHASPKDQPAIRAKANKMLGRSNGSVKKSTSKKGKK